MLVDAGFVDVRVEEKAESREFIKDWMPGSGAEDYVVSANVTGVKPKLADPSVHDASTAAAAAAAFFSQVAGVSLASAGPVGRAVSELLSAVGSVVRTLGEHHEQHTDHSESSPDACCADEEYASSSCCVEELEPEVVEEKKAGC